MPAIYISYRKEDAQGAAAHLYKNLTEAFGRTAVFMNVAGSQPGRAVRDVVDDHLVSCAAMLVIIGKGWADARDESGQRRLDNPLDPVRIETAAALEQDLPLIPVLVQGATMVYPNELPPDLADLAFRNPVTLLQSQWGSDVEMLVALLKSLVQSHRPADTAPADAQAAAAAPAAAPAPAPPAVAEPAIAASASTGSAARVRVARPKPVGKLPWLPMLGALAGIGVLALGVYAFMQTGTPAGRAAAPVPDAVSAVAKVDAPPAPVAKPPPAPAVAASKPAPAALAPTAPTAPAAPAAKAPGVATSPAPTPPPVVAATAPKPALPPLTSKAARVLSFQKWTLNSGGCGAGPVTVSGVARFSVEKTSDAIVVTEEFRGSGRGYDVVVSGQVEFRTEQTSYEIPTAGVWTGPSKTFKTSGTDRVNTSDGLTPNGASVVKFQSLCE